MGVLTLHFVDRQIVAILLPDISADLGLSDTEAGVLTGIGFALLYSILGIPIARLADRSNRVRIIAAAAAIWSGMTAVSGLANGFATMLLARMGVAIGEAGGIPPLHSLVTDLYTEEKRGRAFAIVQLGGPVGILLAFFVFGSLAEAVGWRRLFIFTGAFGVAFAVIFWRFTPEPRARGEAGTAPVPAQAPLGRTIRMLLGVSAYRHLVAGTSIAGFGLYALVTWMPSFLGRVFELPREQIGLILGASFGLGGALGVLVFGALADRFRRRFRSAHASVPALMLAVAAPFAVAAFLAPSLSLTLAFLVPPIVLASGWQAPSIAAVQRVAPPHARAVAASVLMLCLNLIGLGFGPLAVGMLSDALEPMAGSQSLRYGMLCIGPAFAWSALHFFVAARRLAD